MVEKAKKLTQDEKLTAMTQDRDNYRSMWECAAAVSKTEHERAEAAEARPRLSPRMFLMIIALFALLLVASTGLILGRVGDVVGEVTGDGGKTRDLMLKQLGVMDGGGVQMQWECSSTSGVENSRACEKVVMPNTTTASPIVAGSSRTGWPPAGVSSQLIPRPAKHTLEWFTTTPCWVRVTEITPQAKVLLEGSYRAGYSSVSRFDEQATVEVRSGCPGYIDYRINGAEVVPENVSKRPRDSEVVELLI